MIRGLSVAGGGAAWVGELQARAALMYIFTVVPSEVTTTWRHSGEYGMALALGPTQKRAPLGEKKAISPKGPTYIQRPPLLPSSIGHQSTLALYGWVIQSSRL